LGFKAVFLLLVCGLLLLADVRTQYLSIFRSGVSLSLTPVSWLVDVPPQIIDYFKTFQSRQQLLKDNQAYRAKQEQLNARLLKFAALEAENRRIRQLLASSSALEEKVQITEIIATSQDPYRHQIVLNKGERDGVYKGQAVVDAYGVVGQVVRVNPLQSVALLITDPRHGIPVEINRTGLQTIAIGRTGGAGLSLPYLPGNADVKKGDLLVSSALGGRFPAGYPVGEIYELSRSTGGHFMEALAYPSARLNQGRHALLVWSEHNPENDQDSSAQALADAAIVSATVAPPKPVRLKPKPVLPAPTVAVPVAATIKAAVPVKLKKPKPVSVASSNATPKPVVPKPVEKPADKPADKPPEKPTEKPADRPVDKPPTETSP
jgi:rod shape-determining protein MreC